VANESDYAGNRAFQHFVSIEGTVEKPSGGTADYKITRRWAYI